ncbi:hypothetical protein U8335_26225 [Roseiconus lacunae]|uniref:hypothetical protein n=1 Tax=Roseiconus lacunae TaxID=2605694 RepID=UPI00308CB3D0|nr:hypothetical protein U8335_26225 [Stieleria sp. HD01]
MINLPRRMSAPVEAIATLIIFFSLSHVAFARPSGPDDRNRTENEQVEHRSETGTGQTAERFVLSGVNRAIPLLRLKEIKEAINLSEDQERALRRSQERNLEPKATSAVVQQDSSDSDGLQTQKESIAVLRKEWAKTSREHLEEILHPEQFERLYQISLQLRGIGALQDREVMRRLKISSKQRHEMVDRQIAFLRRLENVDLRAADEKGMHSLREQMGASVLGVLNEEQVEQWDAMKGPEFQIPERWHQRGVMQRELQQQPAYPFEPVSSPAAVKKRVIVKQRQTTRAEQPREREMHDD